MNEDKVEELVKDRIEDVVERKVKKCKEGDLDSSSWLDEKVKEEFDKYESSDESQEISRRGFLKALGAGALTLALASSGTAANLLSGTTINSNTVWHAGNDGDNSGLAADKVDGKDISQIEGTVSQARNYTGSGTLQIENGNLTVNGTSVTLT